MVAAAVPAAEDYLVPKLHLGTRGKSGLRRPSRGVRWLPRSRRRETAEAERDVLLIPPCSCEHSYEEVDGYLFTPRKFGDKFEFKSIYYALCIKEWSFS